MCAHNFFSLGSKSFPTFNKSTGLVPIPNPNMLHKRGKKRRKQKKERKEKRNRITFITSTLFSYNTLPTQSLQEWKKNPSLGFQKHNPAFSPYTAWGCCGQDRNPVQKNVHVLQKRGSNPTLRTHAKGVPQGWVDGPACIMCPSPLPEPARKTPQYMRPPAGMRILSLSLSQKKKKKKN